MVAYGIETPDASLAPCRQHLRRLSSIFGAVEFRDGRWVALEIKIGEVKVPGGVRNIERLRENVASNPAARNPRPEFSAAVTAMSMCSPLAPCGRNGMGAVLAPKEKPLIKSCRGTFCRRCIAF